MTKEQERKLNEARDTLEGVLGELEEAKTSLLDETAEGVEVREQASFCDDALAAIEAALGY